MPQLKPTRGIRLNRSHLLARGLVGCWPFNEGSGNKVFDLSGNGNIGIFQGTAPSWGSGKFGSAVNLPGTDEYINCGSNDSLKPTSFVSVVVWIYPTVGGAFQEIIDNSLVGGNDGYFLRLDNSNPPKVQFTALGVGGFGVVTSSNTIALNQWHFIAGIFDGSNWIVDVDGVRTSAASTNSVIVYDAGVETWIGANNPISSPRYFNGKIDHVMIYPRALSASEVALLYREPFCMFGRVNRPELLVGQIVNLAGSSVALSSSSATAKVMRKFGGNVVGTSDVAALLNSIRSLLEVERDWLREALFNGMTANAFKLGTTLSLGWFWVRVAGCSVLYRGSSMGEIDFVNILAVAEKNALEISPSSYISHNSGSTYFYVVRRFNNCGYQERTLAASVKVSIESNGELAEPQPNKVFDSGAKLVDGNKIQLVWYYCLLEQKSQPMCFNVYYDGRTGQIDYENPLAIISYKGRKFYSYQSGALEAGRYLFAIRTEDASGIENSSLARLRIQFDPTNPGAIDILSIEGV
jgi:hypothetical protein